ncbi:MAG: hypothetical protein CL609_23115 [Anaerolineaceae bacterium]|nr:hypothetical protein [Anaerolineaceae bacterium]
MTSKTDPTLQFYLKNVRQNPKNATAWEVLADYLAEQGDEQRAIKCYRQVLALRPGDVEAQVNLERLSGEKEPSSAFEEIADIFDVDRMKNFRIPLVIQVLLAIISFLVTLLLAEFQQWQITDLVWSLWISSLTLGYAYLITGITASIMHGSVNMPTKGGGSTIISRDQVPMVLVIGSAIFMMVFFTIHFGLFHFVHSVFLNLFFPLTGDGFAFPNFFSVIRFSLTNYWSIILLSAVTQLPNFMQLIRQPGKDFMTMPYKNVVKMHLSIFVFAGLSMANISGITLYYLLIVYFFPFGAIKAYFAEKRREKEVFGSA